MNEPTRTTQYVHTHVRVSEGSLSTSYIPTCRAQHHTLCTAAFAWPWAGTLCVTVNGSTPRADRDARCRHHFWCGVARAVCIAASGAAASDACAARCHCCGILQPLGAPRRTARSNSLRAVISRADTCGEYLPRISRPHRTCSQTAGADAHRQHLTAGEIKPVLGAAYQRQDQRRGGTARREAGARRVPLCPAHHRRGR